MDTFAPCAQYLAAHTHNHDPVYSCLTFTHITLILYILFLPRSHAHCIHPCTGMSLFWFSWRLCFWHAHMPHKQTHGHITGQVHDLESMQPATVEGAEEQGQLSDAEMGEAWFPLLDDSGEQVCLFPSVKCLCACEVEFSTSGRSRRSRACANPFHPPASIMHTCRKS
jgi:hypothetical protein